MTGEALGVPLTPWSVLLCGMAKGERLELDPTSPLTTLRGQIGGAVDRHHYLDGVDFWVGDNSTYAAPVNEGATNLLSMLLSAVASGEYPASERERAHARRIVSGPAGAPVVHGVCVVTGADEHANPVALPEAFWGWFMTVFNVGLVRAAVNHLAGMLADSGLEVEVIELDPN